MTARVEREDARFVARIEGINIQGEGESPDLAQEELVQAMLSWISNQDCAESMAGVLSAAGFPQIDDDTELELEFAPHAEFPLPVEGRGLLPAQDERQSRLSD